MSKFLKFIVNLFLIAAILVAAAILVPSVAGVMTTIVDTPSMDTNLPLGSITYSTNVDVRDLKPGDEVLKDSDTATYAYILKTCDPDSGTFTAVSAANPEGQDETVMLRNSVPKVAVAVPYIGYIMMAMHSLEGIIIIALVVVLIIILFVLSELWKPRDDEEEEEAEDVNAVIAAGLDPDDQSGIDTDTIKAAVKDNIAAVNGETPETPAPLTRAEKRALKKAQKKAAKEAAKNGQEETPAAENKEQEGTAEKTAAEAAVPEAPAAPEAKTETVNDAGVTLFGSENDAELFRFGTSEDEKPEEIPADMHVSDVVSAVEQVMAGVGKDAADPGMIPFAADEAEADVPYIPADGDLRMVKRPSLDEIMDAAREAGENPKVRRDDNTGVTVVDFSDVF